MRYHQLFLWRTPEAVHASLRALLSAACLLSLSQGAIAAERSSIRQEAEAEVSSAFDVLHYATHIEPNLSEGSLRGSEVVELRMLEPASILVLDAGELRVDAVRMGDKALRHKKKGRQLHVFLPEPAAAGTWMAVKIEYHGKPKFGMEFYPEREEVYTIFSTSQWMVAVDAPSERASLDLELVLPLGLKATGTGDPLPARTLKDGRVVHRWRQRAPVPSFLYGFAAGQYVEAVDDREGLELRYLSTKLTESELRRIFADTADILEFFGKISGVPYRGRYSQALVADTIGQEMAGLALMSESYGREVLEDRTAESLIAHEAAHQWWGKLVTCRGWTHFWLNEGFANFMAAAYMQHRFGDAVYAKQVKGWKERLERLRADGTDRPLTFERWHKPTADDRAVVYQKGAYVLHLLREELGEDVFWSGIRAYTRGHQGQSVTAADFRRAMEQSSGRDLSHFFAEWVDPAAPSSLDAAQEAP